MLGVTGRGRHPFPPPEFYETDVSPLWLVEGEPDVLSAAELDIDALAVPGVEWAKGERLLNLAERLKDRRTVVCFDCDDQGREAAARVVGAIDSYGGEVLSVDLAPGRSDGFDIGDLLLEQGPERGAHTMVDYMLAAEGEPRQISLEVAA